MTYLLKLQAVDTLFFRDGKPFSMGDDTFATGIFPPPPSVFHGALCSAFLADNLHLLSNASTETASIEITGIYYLKEENDNRLYNKNEASNLTPLLPIPLDLVHYKEGRKDRLSFAAEKLCKVVLSNVQVNSIADHCDDEEQLEQPEGYLSIEELNNYLQLDKVAFSITDNLINTESKIGNALNNERQSTEEGHLYRVNMSRLEKENQRFSFLLVTNFFPASKWLRLGAEGKTVVCTDETAKTLPLKQGGEEQNEKPLLSIDIKTPLVEENDDVYFKIYFATPCVFVPNTTIKNEGWLPDFDSYDAVTRIAVWKGIEMQLITAFVGKPISIGGFDLATKKPKTMYRAIPAGSVYYFKLINNSDKSKLLINFHQKSLCRDPNFKKQGFGIAYMGNLNPNFNTND
ncbi:type III-B CRISPR module-associated protein Cmr3 [Sphingobacteriales bacterium UPWRP_1]|nr:type III-B CRISPR module-associated protein Cmr3 [Sphingobacteriales bacterium TSM_CSM]PSJ78858.1 type III-B CRISPR module-associated protein Cmr3 [Sphingobacteriales bacterium UPWRP_1]